MRNRAKCRLCKSIIESYHKQDYVVCKCGEIGVDGGIELMRCIANDWHNFIRVDDQDNEIIPKIIDGDKIEAPKEGELPTKYNREQLLSYLDQIINDIERLPSEAMFSPITHLDYVTGLLLIRSLLRSD
jgi:hypothetical protein